MNDIDHLEFHYRCCPTIKLLNLLVLDLTNGGIYESFNGKGWIDDKLIKAYNENNLLVLDHYIFCQGRRARFAN
jgi:hypothetical protein